MCVCVCVLGRVFHIVYYILLYIVTSHHLTLVFSLADTHTQPHTRTDLTTGFLLTQLLYQSAKTFTVYHNHGKASGGLLKHTLCLFGCLTHTQPRVPSAGCTRPQVKGQHFSVRFFQDSGVYQMKLCQTLK